MLRLPPKPATSLCCLMLPLLGFACATPVMAGNQQGPGWQQGKPKPKPKPKAKPPASREPSGPAGPSAPAIPLAPPRAVPVEESLQRTIPGNGPLDEDALIRLAIANSPELARRRAQVLIAHAKVKGAGDWQNPELRIGYAWDHDDRIRQPFTERATEQIRASEQFSSTESQTNLAPEFFPGNGESQLQRTSGTLNTSRYRTIERRVTPGRYRDVVETTVYEKRNASERSRQNTTNTAFGTSALTREAGSQNSNRRIVERSREVINHPDDYGRDDQLSFLIRFQLPHPWERRAKIELAAAATARAESDYLIEEDKIVRTVRALYEDLNMGESIARASAARHSSQEKFGNEIEAANHPSLVDLAADIRLEMGKSKRDQREYRSDISRLRQELAGFCGLDRPERIGVIGRPTRRTVNVDSLDVDYLISMAQLHRSDLLDLQARLSVAKAELMGTKAAKIPFATFLDAGWSTAQTDGRSGESEEWSLRLGISLPLFDWIGVNKAHLEHETATTAYSSQIEEQRRLISSEIRTALQRIRSASKEVSAFDSDLSRIKTDAAKSIAQTAIDPVKNLKTRYQNDDLISKFEQDRYEVWSDYYKAVMELERALGTRLEQVLNR